MTTPELRVLSLGAGVQSTTVLLMAIHGEFEHRPDCAIFSDTQWEPRAVYEHLDWLQGVSETAGIPVYHVSAGNLKDDALDDNRNFAAMPLYSLNKEERASQLRRQCTREYKIAPIQRRIRELLDDQIRTRRAELWMGISLDEVQRMKPSRVQYIEHRWPLIEKRMGRNDCLLWLDRHGYPRPPKSSCIGCPLHDTRYWQWLHQSSPDEFAEAVEFDEAIRHKATRIGEPVYLHKRLIPLREIDFSTPEDHGQLTMFNDECTGYCGV
jgi:hypothetical protein